MKCWLKLAELRPLRVRVLMQKTGFAIRNRYVMDEGVRNKAAGTKKNARG